MENNLFAATIDSKDSQKISSVELATLCDKQHKNIIRDIKKLEPSYTEVFGDKFSKSYYINSQNKKQPCYWLSKHQFKFMLNKYGITLSDADDVTVKEVRHEYCFGEDIVKNLFSGYNILPQFPVFGGEYRIDWYIPELNLAIEFDEEQHSSKKNMEADEIRQRRIEKELGCKFARYTK